MAIVARTALLRPLIRAKYGTYRRFAAKIGVSESRVSLILNNHVPMSIHTADLFCSALGLGVGDVLEFKE